MSTIAVNSITDASGGSTATINSVAPNVNNVVGKNLIINGNMRLDQRNSGSSTTINSTSNTYTLDRWMSSGQSSDGVFTVVQSTEVPAGFDQSTKITVTTADASIGSTQSYLFGQFIEGNNVAYLNWGTSNAKTVTLSFWIRSSVTGTFSGVIHNSAVDRCYPFTYTISTADTWEKQTVTITGDTSGTWLTDNGRGITVRFSLGVGSSYLNTAGAWASSTAFGATGETQLISTLNATLYITGVQLEVGESATEFEHRPYGTELALCSRYYWRQYFSGSNAIYDRVYWNGAGNNAIFNFPAPSGMRINAATVTCSPTTNGTGVTFTYHPHGNIIVYRVSASGDNYLYAQDLSIDAEL